MNAVLAQRQRPRADAARDDEDASKLVLDSEFQLVKQAGQDAPSAVALNHSETRLLILAAIQQRHRDSNQSGDRAAGAAPEVDDDDEAFTAHNEVLRKTQEYLSVFARFKDEQTVSAVEHLLKSPENANLHPFEITQLGNLACDDAEEAKALVPSLQYSKSDEELQVLLDHLRRFG